MNDISRLQQTVLPAGLLDGN